MSVVPGSKRKSSKRHKPILVSHKVSPLIQEVFNFINYRNINITDLSHKAGIDRGLIYRWARGQSPRLFDIEAVLQVLDLQLYLGERNEQT